MSVTVYRCAFRSSACCDAPMWRAIFGGGQPDRFICCGCDHECDPGPYGG